MNKSGHPRASLLALIVALAVLGACNDSGSDSQTPASDDDASLSRLTLTGTELDQGFDPTLHDYTGEVGFFTTMVSVAAEPADDDATMTLNGAALTSGASMPVLLDEGLNSVEIEVTNGGSTQVYSLDLTRREASSILETAHIRQTPTVPKNQFGYAVAADGGILAVGVVRDSSNARGINPVPVDQTAASSGALFVYVRDADANWVQDAYIKASNSELGDNFGFPIAVSGNTIVVAALGEDGGAAGVNGDEDDNSVNAAGAVYVFVRDPASGWQQQAYLKPSSVDFTDSFGLSLSLDGDRLAVVSASNEYATAKVYVFERSEAGEWTEVALTEGSNLNDAGFGDGSCSLSGDTIAVGSHLRPNGGGVFVFRRAEDGSWPQEALLEGSNTKPGDGFSTTGDDFGNKVAVDGDLLAVTAPNESSAATGIDGDQSDNSAIASGAVYLFRRAESGTWEQEHYIKASNTDPEDLFGGDVALRNGILVVSAAEDGAASGINGDQSSNGAINSGAAYLFARDSDGNWAQRLYIKSSDPNRSDGFSANVSLSGDALVTSAPNEETADGTRRDTGAVYVFE